MKFLMVAMILAMVASMALAQSDEDSKDKAERMRWWVEARFGLFIHWGLYAIPAGKWGDRDSHGEWIRDTARIPLDTYRQFQPQWNPTRFDADEWMGLAKEAGMKYVVITTKHHDGFALFDSQVSEWDVMNTPFRRDIMREISDAARKNDLVPGWYHSIMDWNHPDYLPRRPWETDRTADGANMDRFVEYLHAQVTELLTQYGPIGVMWFDGEWESTWNQARGKALFDLCRRLQPNVLVNNRVDVGRGGMAGMTEPGHYGDFGTPEQEVPAQGFPDAYWESCITMNGNWGYNAADRNFKSTGALLRLLVDIVSKGGNFLLNVGPKADGTIPEESVTRLKEMGAWMKVNGEAIYGTTASKFASGEEWRSTTKGNTLYVHLFKVPEDGMLRLPGLGSDPVSVTLLGWEEIEWIREGADVILKWDSTPYSEIPVIRMEFANDPIVYQTPTIEAPSDQLIDRVQVEIRGVEGMEVRYTLDGSKPSASSPLYAGPIEVTGNTTLHTQGFRTGVPVTGIAMRTFRQVEPRPAAAAPKTRGRLSAKRVLGGFDRCDQMAGMHATDVFSAEQIGLGAFAGQENFGLIFSGSVYIPSTSLHRFELGSDDGSRLWIGDELVIDNDGLHSHTQKEGIRALQAGWHSLRVEYFNRTGGALLELKVGPVGGPVAPLAADRLGMN